jgi:hypothetical protein
MGLLRRPDRGLAQERPTRGDACTRCSLPPAPPPLPLSFTHTHTHSTHTTTAPQHDASPHTVSPTRHHTSDTPLAFFLPPSSCHLLPAFAHARTTLTGAPAVKSWLACPCLPPPPPPPRPPPTLPKPHKDTEGTAARHRRTPPPRTRPCRCPCATVLQLSTAARSRRRALIDCTLSYFRGPQSCRGAWRSSGT